MNASANRNVCVAAVGVVELAGAERRDHVRALDAALDAEPGKARAGGSVDELLELALIPTAVAWPTMSHVTSSVRHPRIAAWSPARKPSM